MNLGDIRMPWGLLGAQPPKKSNARPPPARHGPYPSCAPLADPSQRVRRHSGASPKQVPLRPHESAPHRCPGRVRRRMPPAGAWGRDPTQVSQMLARHRHATAPTIRARPCPTPSQRVRQHSGASPKQAPLHRHESTPHRWPGRVRRRVPPGGLGGREPHPSKSNARPQPARTAPTLSCAPAPGRQPGAPTPRTSDASPNQSWVETAGVSSTTSNPSRSPSRRASSAAITTDRWRPPVQPTATVSRSR